MKPGPESSYQRIYRVVREIPRGSVATYGQVAALAGLRGHARQVGYALHALPTSSTVPWQRVLNARGEISLGARDGGDVRQRFLLESEGVRFDGAGRVKLAEYGWKRGSARRGPGARVRGRNERAVARRGRRYRIRLIHWNAGEARERAAVLGRLGFTVEGDIPQGLTFLRELGANPPNAVVIDLDRLPSQGRDVALGIRARKNTHRIPLVFVGGSSEKVAGVRRLLPDARFTSWGRVAGTLRRAIANPRPAPARASSALAAYAGRPLAAKLGITAGTTIALRGAPPGFRRTLGTLPEGARLRASTRAGADIVIWFVRRRSDLEAGVATYAARGNFRSLWIAWPKRAARRESELTQPVVRKAGLRAGLVDYRIASIDGTWSGLRFTVRKAKPGAR